jgi:DNA-binding protein YbaB
MFDMMGMLGKVKDLQAKMKEAQESLGSRADAQYTRNGFRRNVFVSDEQ